MWIDVKFSYQSEGSDHPSQGDREVRLFPNEGREDTINTMGLTQEFLIYATEVMGTGYQFMIVHGTCNDVQYNTFSHTYVHACTHMLILKLLL